jgi:tRNA (guanine37-N1)-methyltransferase
MKWVGLITLFPEMAQALHSGITGRAIKQGLLTLECWNPRDFTQNIHRTVDDRPYGGGPGMVMKVEPLRGAIHAAKAAAKSGGVTPARVKTIYLSPQGKRLTQDGVKLLAQETHLILVAGRYEGIDERLILTEIDEEWSIGDYVLSGGELPALVLIDAITRLIPGALGDESSTQEESFNDGLLEYPHYTRPEYLDGYEVPSVLMGGDHAAIERWRHKQALGRTWLRRPDLLESLILTSEQQALLVEFIHEFTNASHQQGN